MYCSNCGTQIPDEANFCWKCGKPQKADSAAEEPMWETCEIRIEIVKDSVGFLGTSTRQTMRFQADAIGPKGGYIPAVSESFQTTNYQMGGQQVKNAVDLLVAQLTRDGWEPAETRGDEWYSYRFRRRVNRRAT